MDRRVIVFALLFGCLATCLQAAGLAPAESPPADFSGRQYIDSKGCVFLRDGQNWAARLARDGSPICGYPATLSARRLSPDGKSGLFGDRDVPARAAQVEEALSAFVVTNLRDGELAGDPRPRVLLRDEGPEPFSPAALHDLQAEIAAQPVVQNDMGQGLRPNLRLCRLLGYDAKASAGIGSDPSQGFCSSLARNDLARLAFAGPVSVPILGPAPTPVAPAPVSVPVKPARVTAAAQPTQSDPTSRPVSASVKKSRTNAPKVTPAPPAASARFVQVGVYARAANAENTIKRVSGLGLPVVQSKSNARGASLHVIMAGPFDRREDLIRALNHVRKAGFRDAYAW